MFKTNRSPTMVKLAATVIFFAHRPEDAFHPFETPHVIFPKVAKRVQPHPAIMFSSLPRAWTA